MFGRRLAALAVGATLVLGLSACVSSRTPQVEAGATTSSSGGGGQLVGVTMPTKQSERWVRDGNNVKTQLEAAGYQVDLQYAENDIPTQVSQLENQITNGAKLLIIAPIDGTAMTSQLEQAHSAGIKVISYDRLIRNSPNVDYYATFDNYQVGVDQATSLLVGLGLKTADGADGTATGPFDIEVFAGSPDDNNAKFFYSGAMDTLKPYLDSGKLVVKSGQTDFDTVATLRWDPATAQSRMENLLTGTYADGTHVAGVLSPYDGLSIGILSALKGNGYGTAGQPYPIVTGQDAEAASVKSIIAGEQYSTIFKDTRDLASSAVDMANSVLSGKEPTVNDSTTYDNGVKVVPTQLLKPVIVDKTNFQQVLIDSGYYTADQVK